MLTSSLSFVFVAGALAAALPDQDLFAPNFPVVAYQLAAAGDVTTYLVGCTAGSDSKTCNFNQPYTLIQGPNTAEFTMSVPGQGVATVGCDLAGKTSMLCVATGDVVSAPSSTVTATTTVTGAAAETHFRAITMVSAAGDLMTYPTPTSTSTSTTTTTSTTAHSTTKVVTTASNSTTTCNSTTTYPTTTSAPLIGTAPANTTVPATVSSSSPTASTLPNAGMLSSSSNLAGVLGAAAAVGAFFLAGVL